MNDRSDETMSTGSEAGDEALGGVIEGEPDRSARLTRLQMLVAFRFRLPQ